MKSQIMDQNTFENVAKKCKWSSNNLGVVRLLLVESKSPSEAVAIYPMSVQQASVLRSRFLKKHNKLMLEQFIQKQKPENRQSNIDDHLENINVLNKSGYTLQQISDYLLQVGVNVTLATLRKKLLKVK